MKIRNQTRYARLRHTTLAIALGMSITGAALAQSRSAGAIFGTAEAGSVVTIKSQDTGLTRTITADASGRYRAAELPIGTYTVSVSQGSAASTRENIRVGVGGTEVDFVAQDLSAVTVTASALPAIDVSSVTSDTTLSSTVLNQIPVARDITQAAVLAPSVIPADSRYGNSVSFGGAAASENAYYINGFAVTNALTNIGSTTLPFDAIDSEQVITGGYSARYGRSTGGVVNVVTKSGSNEWKAGALVTWTPESLRATRKSLYYAPDTGAATAGQLYLDRSIIEDDNLTYGVYASGPLIKDRLFIYATGEWTDRQLNQGSARGASASGGYTENDTKSPRWLTKLDWNINDSNILELTAISDKTGETIDTYSYDFATSTHGDKDGGYRYKDGGETYIGKYTSYLTDSLTLSAMYGRQKVVHYSSPEGYDPSAVYVSDSRPGVANPITGLQPYASLDDPDAYDKTDGYRIDLDWHVGDHDLSIGYDVMNSESQAGTTTSGPGYRWIYYHTDDGTTDQGGFKTAPNSDYVDQLVFANGGKFKVEQKAYYVEDRWQVTDRWLLSIGIRNDKFTNYNSDGVEYVSQKDQWAPRLGVSWDVNGDSSLKLYANAGRYYLAMPLNVAVRGASGSTYTETYYTYTGIDPTTGVPQGLQLIGGPYSSNNEFGQAPDPRTVAAQDLKSHYQDEFIVGMQQALGSSWNWGARLQYRDLKSAIDDQCDNRPMLKYMIENNIAIDPNYSYSPDCRLFNPGADNTMLLDLPDAAGSPELVAVPYSKEDMGMYLKRRYIGLDLFLEHPFDGKWFGRVDYTLSHNYGNDEGQLNSDIGQSDVSQTVLYDHAELMAYGGGNLPNDRRHVLKAYGYYQFAPEWRVGGTLVAQTGRPKQCLGYYQGEGGYNPPNVPTSDGTGITQNGYDFWNNYLNYGPYYHYCDGQPTQRGAAGRLPSDIQLSLNAAYMPHWAPGLSLQLDVFNVLNKQVAQNITEIGENGGPGVVYSQRGRVISYDAPRAVRFTARYDFSL
jgi:hypothetical protein